MNERTQLASRFIVSHLLLIPLLLLVSFLMPKAGVLVLPVAQIVLLILLLAGYWEFISFRFKWIYFLSMELLLIGIRISISISGENTWPRLIWIIGFALLQLYLLAILIRIILVIYKNEPEKLEIEFPFKQGVYLITDGGNSKTSRLMNYHYHSIVHKRKQTNKSMLYATDVVKLDARGPQFMPPQNEDYPIFGENIYSPLDGEVVRVVNDIDDNIPFSGNYPYNTGNTVVIRHENYYFLLGHLKKGSIVVSEGHWVAKDTLIAQAGNSGMSERPHLHMQLMKSDNGDYWKGNGISICYQGKNLYKNRLVKI